jgi:hypothetical protein
MQAYGEHTDERYPTTDDPAIMVLRVWQDLPPSLVLSAIDEILDRAKDVDEREHDIQVGVSAKKGDASFFSVYEFRLYELIPVLDQLDKTEAESLLGKNSEAQTSLEHYPQGFSSMNAVAQPRYPLEYRYHGGHPEHWRSGYSAL